MSIDSASSSPRELSTYNRRSDLNLPPNNALQSSLSHSDRIPVSTTKSLKSSTRPNIPSRNRAISDSEEASADTVTELTQIPTLSNKYDNKRDRRESEVKTTADRREPTPVERRNSTPQLHFSSLIPHAFRANRHNNKANTKDETNMANTAPSNYNASNASSSSSHYSDMATMKTDPPFSLKSQTISSTNSRLIPSHSNDRLLQSLNEDLTSSSIFILDEIKCDPRSAELFIFESRAPLCISKIYREFFFDHFHINYSGEFEQEGLFIASLRYIYHKTATTDTCEARTIIRIQSHNYDISETVDITNENNILQVLFNKAQLSPVRIYGPIGDPKANEKIYLFDKVNDERYNCKIGVIYQRLNQTDEYEIFSNDYLSNDMREFLDRISHRISLKSFLKYRADLDTTDDLHGEYSYYTEYENHEIMFNVAPIIPSTKANGQCIERKSLVGNAFVCVVFQEPGTIFKPDFISGKVTQVYITVQPIIIDEELHYKIFTWRRNDITSIIDPPGGIYRSDKPFRHYFLTLILNSINVAVESPSLRGRVFEQRRRLKCEELKKLSNTFNVGPIPDFAGEFENITYPTDTRSNTRSESFGSNMTATTSDSASTNTGRASPVLSKKKGFSKIFGVFSGRSASISNPSGPPPQVNNEGSSFNSQPSTPDVSMTLGRMVPILNKDSAKRTPSIKLNQAPVRPVRPPVPPQNQHAISVQPPTPSTKSPYENVKNPLSFVTDNLSQNNHLNTAALDIAPRSRSNSSPEDTVNANKPQSLPGSVNDEENDCSNNSNNEDSEEDSTDGEKPPSTRQTVSNIPLRYSPNTNS